jgi:hypothetical protein
MVTGLIYSLNFYLNLFAARVVYSKSRVLFKVFWAEIISEYSDNYLLACWN